MIMKEKCKCAICSNNLPFEIPQELIDSLLSQNLVLFAGAGISTENKKVFEETLYEDVYDDLELSESDISFPDLMSKFCNTRTNGRQKLLEKIKKRFDYIHQFSELYVDSSSFHREIAKFWMLENIITTNWDDHFERECNAIPIVTPEDFVFYNINSRKVFKIHGSISNYGSIVATKEDYEKCYENLNSGLVGANLKTLLATKTILFVGYSFRDFDFNKVLELLKSEMGNVFPHFYIISLDDSIPELLNGLSFTHIKTSGQYLFEKIREHLISERIILPDEFVDAISDAKFRLKEVQRKVHDFYFNRLRTSSIIFSSVYMDGISHAIDNLLYKTKSGETYNPHALFHKIDIYSNSIQKKLSKEKNYIDLAYVKGYIVGLQIPFHFEDLEEMPFHFIYGIGETNDDEIAFETFEKDIIRHKSSEKYCRKYLKEYLNNENEMILRHRAFI